MNFLNKDFFNNFDNHAEILPLKVYLRNRERLGLMNQRDVNYKPNLKPSKVM